MTQPSYLSRFRLAAVFFFLALAVKCPGQGLIAPVQGYLSVEPFELRKEFVMRFDTIAERIGASDIATVDASNREELEQKIGDWLDGKCPVTVDGSPVSMERDRVHFVRTDPEKGLVVEDRESVPASEALVGAVFATALEGPPDEVRVTWEIFPADGSEAVVEAGARGQRAARKLTPENPELVWKGEMGLAVPELVRLPPAPQAKRVILGGWWTIGALLVVALAILGFAFTRRGWRCVGALAVSAVVAVVAIGQVFPLLTRPIQMPAEEADEICYALLRNIYHAFDYRRESDIYDVLAKSADGDLLTQIYLEVQRSLQVESQGGARVRVTDLDLRECELSGAPTKDAFFVNCEWVAVGTVTHWGHTHDRVNRYKAKMTIGPRDGEWRLIGLELVNEERI
ncbi:MAG: hypothetical protein KDN19_18240 [Verrucomicrobiae bacterium]|nr:hypothetical protein [Verrucomicrobiae bacterium]